MAAADADRRVAPTTSSAAPRGEMTVSRTGTLALVLLAILLSALLLACGSEEPTEAPTAPLPTVAPTRAQPTPTPVPPTRPPTATAAPTATPRPTVPRPTATPEPTRFATPEAGGTADVDRDALVALYDATNGPAWKDSTNWLSDEPLAKWHGVTMDGHGRVVELWLNENGLSGQLPPDVGLLARLEWLDLSSNDLTGPIPPELGHLGHLSFLDLSGNGLRGEIPVEMGLLAELATLSLANNALSGDIPVELNDLVALESLDLAENELSGCVADVLRDAAGIAVGLAVCPAEDHPVDRGALVALFEASADGEHRDRFATWLTDEPLGEWKGVSTDIDGRVVKLDFRGSGWVGELPTELGNLARLVVLNFGQAEPRDNELTGGIPVELGRLANLRVLDLGVERAPGYSLTGEIPRDLGKLTNLRRLNLSGNQLTGEIPAELGNLEKLRTLGLFANQLTGEIPAELGNLSRLQELYLHWNQLRGEIPEELNDGLTGLRVLTLHRNSLTGCLRSNLRVRIPDLSNLGNLKFC